MRGKKTIFGIIFLAVIIFGAFFALKQSKTPSTSEFETSISQKGNTVSASLKNSGSKISFNVPLTEAKMTQDDSTTKFDNDQATLSYETKKEGKEKGLKETITLKIPSAPNEFFFNLNLENVSSFRFNPLKKSWHFFNSSSKEVFYIPPGFMVDAAGVRSDSVAIKITKEASGYLLSVTADKAWLSDPTRAFPVSIDPSVVIPQADSNYIVITDVGRFRWKLAVEYEIHESTTGKLLGSDVLITDIRLGETATDIFGFLGDYLTRRNAIWLLSQGKYTLYEQSFDRLTAPHFQKGDSGDGVADKYKTERYARRELLDTLQKEDYPAFSLTLDEAKKLRGGLTFIMGNEKIGAGTEVLRPNGAGDATGIPTQIPGTGAHWDKVDEAVADDTTTYVAANTDAVENIDYYALQDTALTTETIDSIDATFRLITDSGFGYGGVGVRRAGSNTFGTNRQPASWTAFTESSLARPGAGTWAVGDLNGLQSALRVYINSGAEGDFSYCTQIYITVNYTAAVPTNTPTPTPTSTPTPTPTPTPMIQIKSGTQFRGGVILNP